MAGEPELRKGSTETDWVTYLQQMLNHHYQQSVVAEDGHFGDELESVVKHAQEQNNLPVDGVVGNGLWAVLTGGSSGGAVTSATAGEHHGDDAHFEFDVHDYPELARVHHMGDDYLAQFFDLHGQEAGVSVELASRICVEPATHPCHDKLRYLMVCTAAVSAAIEELIRSPSIGGAVALMTALLAWLDAYLQVKECLRDLPQDPPQLPPGILDQVEESYDHAVADVERLRTALPS